MMKSQIRLLLKRMNESSNSSYGEKKNVHLKFLAECNDHLFQYFKNHYKEKFNFSALSYRNTDTDVSFDFIEGKKKPWSYNFHEENMNGAASLRRLFQDFIEEAKEGKTINLTYVLTTQIQDQEVFMAYSQGSSGGAQGDTIGLDDLDFKEDYQAFFEENLELITSFCKQLKGNFKDIEKYGRYIWNYKRIVNVYTKENPDKPFYLYFIRPSSLVSDYRILLSISTNSPISSDDLGVLNFILHRIVSQTALEKFKNTEKLLREKIEIQDHARSLEEKMSFIELNTYHHLGSNLKGLPDSLDLDNFGSANLTSRQRKILISTRRYATALLTNITNTLKTYKEALRSTKKSSDLFPITTFFAEIEGVFSNSELITSENLLLKKGVISIPSPQRKIKTNPSLVRRIIESQVANMNSEFAKPEYSNLKSGEIIINVDFISSNYTTGYIIIEIENNFSIFRPEIIANAGIEPIKNSTSSGLGFYFLNSMLSWSKAKLFEEENRYFSLKNRSFGGLGVCVSFNFETIC